MSVFLIGSMLGIAAWLQGDGVVVGRLEKQDDVQSEIGLWTSVSTIEQTFIASQDNLCRVDFFLKSYHPWDTPSLECRLFEIDATDRPDRLSYDFIVMHRREVRRRKLNGWLFSPHMFNRFAFAPIPDSRNKRYMLSIQAPDLKRGGTSILLSSPRDRYDWGNLFVNGAKRSRDLGFRVLYRQPRVQIVQQSIKAIALQKPWLFAHEGFYYLLLLVYLGLLIAVVLLFL